MLPNGQASSLRAAGVQRRPRGFAIGVQVSDRMLDWWGGQPDSVYRTSAAALLDLWCLMQWFLYAISS